MEQLAEFAGNHVLMVLALLGSFALVAAFELRLRAQGVTQISPADAVKLINKSALIVDLRAAEAFGNGHIANARNLTLAEIEKNPETVHKNKGKILLTVCDSGTQSAKAASLLRKAGFTNTFSLRGGIKAWQGENLPLAK